MTKMDLLTKALNLIDRADLDGEGDLDCLGDEEDKLQDDSKYQNENAYNRLLPYDISAESQEHLMRIKTSLAKCIQLDQETIYEWFIDLERFIDLYGLAFTKEEHIYFVKLQYEIIISEGNMDLYYISYVARCFSRLMQKRGLLTSEELQLDWRPLYETYERLLFNETESMGLRFVPDSLESNLSQAIRLARPHFPLEATQEMLEEWRPMLCPFDVSIQRAFTYLNLFLPTTLPPEHHDKGFKLWFEEIMQLWLSGKNCGFTYESKLTLLLARLASDCMGFIDWEPYIAKIFDHFKISLNLQGGISRTQQRRQHESVDIGPSVQWIVYMISKENSCLEHISKLFKAIESFYHPSNTDRRWHTKLQQFLYKLPACYVKRLYRERFKKNIWSKRLPESHKLTDEQTTKFVNAIMPVVLTSMFNQAGLSSAVLAFRDLSVLRPELVVPPLLDRLYGSYETLTEPHRLLASINCMASVVPAMVRPCKYFPEGPSHVIPLLLNSLPGIDSNDMRKCIAVFRFVATLAAHVRMKDYSYLVDERPELTYEQQQLCLSTAQFEDFVIQFLDKCFILIENTATTTFSNLDQETHSKNGEEGIVEAAISSVTLSILAQASPEIQQAALDKLYSHVTRHIFDTKTQGKAIATLCLACAKSNPKETLDKFVPRFGKLILTLTDNEEVFQESILDNELLFSLLLMSEIVRCNSPHLLDHKDLIVEVLHRSLKLTSKEGYMLGCGILRHLLRALTNITCCDWRNIDYDDEVNKATEEKWPFDNWGHTTHVKDLKLKWDIPGPESRKFAQELLEMFLKRAVQDLIEWSQDKRQLSREQVQRSLHTILSSLIGAASVLPSIKSTIIDLCPYEVPVVPMCIRYTGTEPLDFFDGTNIRTWVMESMRRILDFIKRTNEDDTKSLMLICEIFVSSISYFGYNKSELRCAAQRIKTMKNGTQNKLLGSRRYLRYLLVERVAQQQRAMLLNKGAPDFTQLHLDVFRCLFDMAQSHYVEVRIIAQDTVYLMMNLFPFVETILVPMLVVELRKSEIEHKKFKGLLYLAIGRRSYTSIAIDPNWSFLKQLWPAIVESPHSEKPSIVKLLDRICSLVQKGFDTFALHYGCNDKLKRLAASIWDSNFVDISMYKAPESQYIEMVQAQVHKRNKQRVEDYEQLVLKLVELIENPHLHWHRKIVAYSLFTHLTRDDHPLPLAALNLCISSLISERLSIRLKAIQLVSAQLKLHKRQHLKRKIKISKSKEPIKELVTQAERISLNEDSNSVNQINDKCDEETKQSNLDESNIISGNSNKWMQYKFIDRNYTEDEWNKMIFIDKPHIGFYQWPKELEVYEIYEKQPVIDRSAEQMNKFELAFFKKFTDPEFVDKLVNYFIFEDNKGSDIHRFDIKRPALFKGVFRNFGPCMIEPFRKYVLEFASSTCEQKQKFVIEFLAGLLRGSKHWSYKMMDDLREFVLPIMKQMTVTQENFNDWTGMTNYVFRDRDARRFMWLLDHFVRKATSQVADSTSPTITPFIQASRLTLAHYTLIQCEWRAVDHIFPIVMEHLKPQNHLLAYANVRTCLASIYSLIFMFDDPVAATKLPDTLTGGPKRVDFIASLLPKLAKLEKSERSSARLVVESDGLSSAVESDISLKEHSSSHLQTAGGEDTLMATHSIAPMDTDEASMVLIAKTLMKYRQVGDANPELPSSSTSIAAHHDRHHSNSSGTKETKNESKGTSSFVDNLREALPDVPAHIRVLNMPASSVDSSIGDGNTSEESQERKDAIKLMKLTTCWIIYNVCRMKSPVPADFFKLLPVICDGENSDPELAAESLAAVAVLGTSCLSPGAVEESLSCIRKIIGSRSWHARVAAAAFIEIMVSANLFKLLTVEKWRAEIEDIVINSLICDERIEVRESSALTLSGMIHCEFTKLTPQLLNEFKSRASEPLVKRKQSNGTFTIDPKNTVRRHSGILCLCACVDAYPYTVPDHLPEILTLLSDHLTDPQPISVSIVLPANNLTRTCKLTIIFSSPARQLSRKQCQTSAELIMITGRVIRLSLPTINSVYLLICWFHLATMHNHLTYTCLL